MICPYCKKDREVFKDPGWRPINWSFDDVPCEDCAVDMTEWLSSESLPLSYREISFVYPV